MKIYDIILEELEKLARVVGDIEGIPIYRMDYPTDISKIAELIANRIQREIIPNVKNEIIEHQKDVLKMWEKKLKNQKVIAEGRVIIDNGYVKVGNKWFNLFLDVMWEFQDKNIRIIVEEIDENEK